MSMCEPVCPIILMEMLYKDTQRSASSYELKIKQIHALFSPLWELRNLVTKSILLHLPGRTVDPDPRSAQREYSRPHRRRTRRRLLWASSETPAAVLGRGRHFHPSSRWCVMMHQRDSESVCALAIVSPSLSALTSAASPGVHSHSCGAAQNDRHMTWSNHERFESSALTSYADRSAQLRLKSVQQVEPSAPAEGVTLMRCSPAAGRRLWVWRHLQPLIFLGH